MLTKIGKHSGWPGRPAPGGPNEFSIAQHGNGFGPSKFVFLFFSKTLFTPPFSTLNWALPIWTKSRWTRAAQWATRDVAGIWEGWGRGGSRKRRLERRRAFGSAGAREEGEGAEERRGSEIP
jgi:hypothetical protein